MSNDAKDVSGWSLAGPSLSTMQFEFTTDEIEEELPKSIVTTPTMDLSSDPLHPIVIPARLPLRINSDEPPKASPRPRSSSFTEGNRRNNSDANGDVKSTPSSGMRGLLSSFTVGKLTSKPTSPSTPSTPGSTASPQSTPSITMSLPGTTILPLPSIKTTQSTPAIQGLGLTVPLQPATNFASASDALKLMQNEGNQVAEGGIAYATVLEDLFAEFILLTTDIIRQGMIGERERDITHLARPGQDLRFDRLIQNLATFASYNPRLTIDSLMAWRRIHLDQCQNQEERSRKAKMVDVLMMRALSKILTATTSLDNIDADYLSKLEHLIFHRVQAVEPEIRTLNRQVHWEVYAQCMGIISQLHNSPILQLYTQEVQKLVNSKDVKLAGFVHALGYLKLKMYPQEALDESSDFVRAMGMAFQNSHGTRTKTSFAEALVEMLEPVAASIQAEVNIPNWTKAVEAGYPKAVKMMGKTRYYQVAMPLITTILSVASSNFVSSQYQFIMEQTLPKMLKEKPASLRRLALACMVRLLWISLFRPQTNLSNSAIHGRLNSLFKILFPKGRDLIPSETPGVGEPLILVVYYVANRHFDYAMEQVILPLLTEVSPAVSSSTAVSRLSSSSFFATTEDPIVNLESQLSPDRMVVALRAFYLVLKDLEIAANVANAPPSTTTGQLMASAGVKSAFAGTKVSVSPPIFPPLLDPVSVQALLGSPSAASPFSRTPNSEPWDFLRRAYLNVMEVLSSNPRIEKTWSSSKRGQSRKKSLDLEVKEEKSQFNDYIPPSVQRKMGTSVKEAVDKVSEEAIRILNMIEPVLGDMMFGISDPTPVVSSSAPGTPVMGDSQTRFGSMLGTKATSHPARRSSVSDINLGTDTEIFASDSAFLQTTLPTPGSEQLQSLFELTKACIDGFPRLNCKGGGIARLVRLLARLCLNIDDGVRKSASDALLRISLIDEGNDAEWHAPDAGDGILPPCPTHSLAAYCSKVLWETIINFINDHPVELCQMTDHEPWNLSLSTAIVLTGRWSKQLIRVGQSQPAIPSFIFLESVALLLLSSSLPTIRGSGVQLTSISHELATKVHIDASLGHVYNILSDRGLKIVQQHYLDPELLGNRPLTEAERLQQLGRRQQLDQVPQALMELAGSWDRFDSAIWLRCWPTIFTLAWRDCPRPATQGCQEAVWRRLQSLTPFIYTLTDLTGPITSSSSYSRFLPFRTSSMSTQTLPAPAPTISNWLNHPAAISLAHEDTVAEWRNLLVIACTAAQPEVSPLSTAFSAPNIMSNRTGSGFIAESQLDSKISSRALFQSVLPLLSCDRALIRFATVAALTKIPATCVSTFYTEVVPVMKGVMEEGSTRMSTERAPSSSYFRTPGVAKRIGSMVNTFTSSSSSTSLQAPILGRRADRMRSSLLHLFSQLATLLSYPGARQDGDVIAIGIAQFIVEVARFLADPTNAAYDLDALQLFIYFSKLVHNFYQALADVKVSTEPDVTPLLMSVELRHDLYRILSNWCGFGPQFQLWRESQNRWRNAFMDTFKDFRERDNWGTVFDEQLKSLATSSLAAMTRLCKGPMTEKDTSNQSCFAFPVHGHSNDVRFEELSDGVHSLSNSLGVRDGLMVRPFNLENVISLFDEACAQTWDLEMTRLGSTAVTNIIANNPQATGVLDDVVRRCYITRSSQASDAYFNALTRAMVANPTSIPLLPAKAIVLGLYKMSDPSFDVRTDATRLLDAVEKRLNTTVTGNVYEKVSTTASLGSIVTFGSEMACTRWARMFPNQSFDVVSEITFWCESLVADARRGSSGSPMTAQGPQQANADKSIRLLLSLSFPWIRNCIVSRDGLMAQMFGHAQLSLQQQHYAQNMIEALLGNIVVLTLKFGDAFPRQVENMWVQLVDVVSESSLAAIQVQENIKTALQFILDLGIKTRNSAVVPLLKTVVLTLTRTPACQWTLDFLLQYLTPAGFTPTKSMPDSYSNESQVKLYRSNTALVLEPMPRRPALSYGQLALSGIVDIILELGPVLVLDSLPTLLHIAVVHLDHIADWFGDQCRLLLVQLIDLLLPLDNIATKDRTLVVRERLSNDLSPTVSLTSQGGSGTTDYVKPGLQRLWQYEDVSPNRTHLESFDSLRQLVLQLDNIFAVVYPDIDQAWGNVALEWGVDSSIKHTSARSLQVFRTLLPDLNKENLGSLLHRLSRVIGSNSEEAQGISLEILLTLQCLVEAMDLVQLYHTPAIFWTGVAGLTSQNDWEFSESLKLLELVTSKLDLSDGLIVSSLQSCGLAMTWTPEFVGLLPLLLRGMSSHTMEPPTLKFIEQLLDVRDDWLVGKIPLRHLYLLLSFLPRLMETPVDQVDLSRLVSYMANRGYPDLARIVTALGNSNRIYRSVDEWSRHLAIGIKDAFFPEFELEATAFLLSLLENSSDLYRRHVLLLLRGLLPHLKQQALLAYGQEVLSPMLKLLRSDMSQEVNDVFNVLVEKPSGRGNTMTTLAVKLIFSPATISSYITNGSRPVKRVREPTRIPPCQINISSIAASLVPTNRPQSLGLHVRDGSDASQENNDAGVKNLAAVMKDLQLTSTFSLDDDKEGTVFGFLLPPDTRHARSTSLSSSTSDESTGQ